MILEEHHLVLQDRFSAQPEQQQSAELVWPLCTPILGFYWAGELFTKSCVRQGMASHYLQTISCFWTCLLSN